MSHFAAASLGLAWASANNRAPMGRGDGDVENERILVVFVLNAHPKGLNSNLRHTGLSGEMFTEGLNFLIGKSTAIEMENRFRHWRSLADQTRRSR